MAYFSPYIDETGLHMPSFDDRLEELWNRYCEIFGTDPDTASSAPDYQLLSLLARNLDDVSQFVIQVYESMNPGIEPDNIGIYYYTGYQSAPSAAGNGLDLLMAQYGLAREYRVNNYPSPVINDTKCRDMILTALPGKGSVDLSSLEAAVQNVFAGRSTQVRIYLNDTDITDSAGIPPRSVAVVVDSLAASSEKMMKQVGQAIFDHLPPGIRAYGDTAVSVQDAEGDLHTVCFTKAQLSIAYFVFYITKQEGADEQLIRDSISPWVCEYVNSLPIGTSLPLSRLIGIAYASNPEIAGTYVITNVCGSLAGSGWIWDVINCPWNEYMFAGNKSGWMVTYSFS